MSDRTDEELMLRIQKGDDSAFEELVTRNSQRIMNLVYRFLGGTSEAEDIAQEVFVRIYKARETYQPQARFTTWLYTICRNTCFKHLEKQKRRPALVRTDEEAQDMLVSLQDDKTVPPPKAIMHDELSSAVKDAVDSLPEAQRMAFILHKYEDLSYAEIGEIMDCSFKAIKSLMHRARMNLKDRMREFL